MSYPYPQGPYPYRQVSVLGTALETYGFEEENTTDGLALLTFGFVTGILGTTCWQNALSEGVTSTIWSLALSEGITLTSWQSALSEGQTGTVWIDAISEVPPGSSCS